MTTLQEISGVLIVGNANKVRELTQKALAEGVSPGAVIDEALIPGMNEVGRRFKANEFYVPEVLIAARAMKAGMDIVRPLLAEGDIKSPGKVVIGTVKGDLHDIGKNLVVMMLKGAGFEVVDTGIDTPAEKFIAMAKEAKPDIVAMSALLTTTMIQMKSIIEALKGAGLRDQVKIMVGGAPLTQRYADEIGADGYAPDAASAVDIAKELLGIPLV